MNDVANTSESMAELAKALAQAQGAMGGALKDSSNPFFKSKYADLQSVWTACRKALADNGLAVIQTTDFVEMQGVRIITTLVHSSGQWIRGALPIKAKDETPQGIGSAITYARRYALAAMVGVYQTDDDAEAAHGRANGAQEKEQPNGTRKQVKDYSDRMMKAFEIGVDQAVLDIHTELQEDQDLYRAVWGTLPSTMRRQLKEMVERSKS